MRESFSPPLNSRRPRLGKLANIKRKVRNIVEVTILEVLGDEETVLRNAFSYFSEDLMTVAQSVEKGWGRRDIKIWHRRGRPQYDWTWPPAET